MLKFHLARRIQIHLLSFDPLNAGDVFQPGRSQVETGLTIGKGPIDPGPSSNFLHQPFQRIVHPDFAPMAVGEAVTAERLLDLLFVRISRLVQPLGTQSGNHSPGFSRSCFPALVTKDNLRNALLGQSRLFRFSSVHRRRLYYADTINQTDAAVAFFSATLLQRPPISCQY